MQNNLSNNTPCYATQYFFKERCHTKIQNIPKILYDKAAQANFGSEKQFKVKKSYFITTEVDLIGEKQPFLTNRPFLQIKQGNIRQKYEKSQCRCIRTHEM